MNKVTKDTIGRILIETPTEVIRARLVKFEVQTEGEPSETIFRFVGNGTNIQADNARQAVRQGLKKLLGL